MAANRLQLRPTTPTTSTTTTQRRAHRHRIGALQISTASTAPHTMRSLQCRLPDQAGVHVQVPPEARQLATSSSVPQGPVHHQRLQGLLTTTMARTRPSITTSTKVTKTRCETDLLHHRQGLHHPQRTSRQRSPHGLLPQLVQ